MTSAIENGKFGYVRVPLLDDFEVCYAGPIVIDGGRHLCIGSTDGKVMFADKDGRSLMPPRKGSFSEEAINGIELVGNCVGVSTRQDVNFWQLPGTPGGQEEVQLPCGAHGIAATTNGYFISPLGRNGIMAAQPPFDREASVIVYNGEGADLYVYRLIILRSLSGTETIVCATRHGGIAYSESVTGQENLELKRGTLAGLDAVDICPLAPGTESRALAVLGRDGKVILFQDVIDDNKPTPVKFEKVKGVAYRVLSSHGDIHLLTSKGFYVLGALAGRFLRHELTDDIRTPVHELPMEVVDVNLVDDRWLLLVTPDSLARFDLDVIHREVLDHLNDAEIQATQLVESNGHLKWEWSGIRVKTITKQLTLASPG